jgi:hypothetical protein
MTWVFDRNYRNLGQVEEFYPAYRTVFEELQAAEKYPYNAEFKGRIPGIEGSGEDTAIYLLQCLRALHETQAQIDERREAGWRDFDPGELGEAPKRFAHVAEYAIYHPDSHAAGITVGGSGLRQWDNARVTRFHISLVVLPGRNHVNGHLVSGRLLVKDI